MFTKHDFKFEMFLAVCWEWFFIDCKVFCSTGWPLCGKHLDFSLAVLNQSGFSRVF